MKIGLDLHGVISDIPDTMRMLTKAIINDGGEVHILTGSITEKAKKELSELGFEHGIHYTHVMGLPDYLLDRGETPTGRDKKHGNPIFPDEVWNKGKASYCWRYGIDLHMDDTLEYGDHFITPFARLWTKNK